MNHHNRLHLILGPMFASKSGALVSAFDMFCRGGHKVLMVRYKPDAKRYGEKIQTHDGRSIMDTDAKNLIFVDRLSEIPGDLIANKTHVFIEELQAFKDDGPWVLTLLKTQPHTSIIAAALSGDINQKMWPVIVELLPYATVESRQAVCNGSDCLNSETKRFAPLTMIKDTSKVKTDGTLTIGGAELYYPSCLECLFRAEEATICQRYKKEGSCRFGSECLFSHGAPVAHKAPRYLERKGDTVLSPRPVKPMDPKIVQALSDVGYTVQGPLRKGTTVVRTPGAIVVHRPSGPVLGPSGPVLGPSGPVLEDV